MAFNDKTVPDMYAVRASITLEHSGQYAIGVLQYEDEQWTFTPTNYGEEL